MKSALTRPLRLRIRPDVQIRTPGPSGEKVWILRDPVTLRYFRLIREEYELLRLLDGEHSLVDLQKHFNALFSPLRLEMERLTGFLSRLYSEGLLIADSPGQAVPLSNRRKKNQRQSLLARWANPLAIRGPGVSPGPFLDGLARRFGWLFSLPGAALASLLIVAAFSLLLAHWREVASRLPQLQFFFEGRNFLLLLAVLAVVKVIHELGHAVACRKFGGQCHQIGMMFLVFVPTLYCDVSDAWLIPQKRKRIIISAAGMYVEILLASLATLLWWNSSQGVTNAVCLNVMLVCSVSTLLVNGNPLLRYDGYYILSDLVNMPNLRQRSANWWKRLLKSRCLGLEPLPEELPSLRRHAFLLCVYGLLSTVFRWFIIGTILWLVYRFLSARELSVFYFPFLLLVLAGVVGPPCKQTTQLLNDPLQRSRMKPIRIAATLLVLLSVILFICCVPLPAYVYCPLLVEPADAQYIYAYQSGRLQEAVKENSKVEAGDQIFRLADESFELQLEELAGRLAQQESRVLNLEARSARTPEVQNEIPLARELLRNLRQQHRRMQDRKSQLHGYAAIGGTVFPPPVSHRVRGSELDPVFYSGTPLDPVNAGCWIEAGTQLCTIGNPETMQATLLANEHQLKLIRRGQRASVLPASVSLGIIPGRVTAIGKTRQDMAPEQYLPDDRIVVVPQADGTKALVNPLWEVRVRWAGSPQFLEPGMRGTARIQVRSMTLLTRFLRWVNVTFQT